MSRGHLCTYWKKLMMLFVVFVISINYSSAVFANNSQQSQVDISATGSMELLNLNLNAGELSPDSNHVMVVGADGFTALLDADNPSKKSILNTNSIDELNDVSWHPLSQSALLVGDNGTVLKYSKEGNNVTRPIENANLFGADIHAVDWRGSGQWAYVGGESGTLYRYRAADGYIKIENNMSSDITSISCHHIYDYCMFTTLEDGFGLIDRDHEIHLFGNSQYTWLASSCSVRGLDRCAFFGSNLAVAILDFSRADASLSKVNGAVTFLSTSTASEFSSVSALSNEKTMLHLTPYGLVEYNIEEMAAYPWINNDDVTKSSVLLSTTNPLLSWDTGNYDGWVISSDGTIASYYPLYVEALSGWDEGPTILVMMVVIVVVPGSIIGLIFMFSDRAQNWWKVRARAKRLKKIKDSSKKGKSPSSYKKKAK